CPVWAFGQNMAQNQVFLASNEVFIKIFATDKNYDFRSEKFAGRFDENQNFFEFNLPLNSVAPLESPNDITVFKDLFMVNLGNHVINLTASFQDPLTNIKDFNSPQEFVMDGWLTVADKRYNVPVIMSLFYNNDVLFYRMRTEVDMYTLKWPMPVHYQKFLTGMLQIQVNDGQWRDLNKMTNK
ncbi:MAG: hypothetical protein M3512_11225, partial [Bacteroidota bacterium]|nr:hypothetical protein [Bacteroidota bacterium]